MHRQLKAVIQQRPLVQDIQYPASSKLLEETRDVNTSATEHNNSTTSSSTIQAQPILDMEPFF
jgi:hypothetical protein